MLCLATPPATTKRPRPCFYTPTRSIPAPAPSSSPATASTGSPTHPAGDRPAARAHPRARAPDRGHGAHAPARPHPAHWLAADDTPAASWHAPPDMPPPAIQWARPRAARGCVDHATPRTGQTDQRGHGRHRGPRPRLDALHSTPSCARLSPAPSPASSLRWPMPPRQPFPFWPRSSPRPSSVPMWPSPSCSPAPSCASCGLVSTAAPSPRGSPLHPTRGVRTALPRTSHRSSILAPL